MTDEARDILASLFGLGIAAVGTWCVHEGLTPWYVAPGSWIVGAYLVLPRRMRVVGRLLAEAVRQARGD